MKKKTNGRKGLLIFLFLMMIISGCKSKEERELEEANKQLEDSIKRANEAYNDYYELQNDIENLERLQDLLNGYSD